MVHASGFRPGGSWLFKNRIIFSGRKICFGEELRRKNPALGDKNFVAQFVCTFESKTLIIINKRSSRLFWNKKSAWVTFVSYRSPKELNYLHLFAIVSNHLLTTLTKKTFITRKLNYFLSLSACHSLSSSSIEITA